MKWCLRNEHRNSFFANCDYQNLGSASDWLCWEENLLEAIKGTTQIWAMTRHQYGISVISIDFLQLFLRETSNNIAKCQLFSQAKSCPLPSFPFNVFTLLYQEHNKDCCCCCFSSSCVLKKLRLLFHCLHKIFNPVLTNLAEVF